VSAQVPDTLLEWALTVVGGSTLIVFLVALQNFFVQPPTLTRLQRLFQDLSVLVGITHGFSLLVLNSATDLWAGIGIALYSVSLTLFLSAIESARRTPLARTFVYEPKCDTILQNGPYRFIRHPIYLSYSLAWLAAPVATHSLVLGATALLMIGCYVASAHEEERRLAVGRHAAEYEKYRARTWRMIPFLY
jgi:protein-S-isoprenylcysteine O-methyltransferase Ste14